MTVHPCAIHRGGTAGFGVFSFGERIDHGRGDSPLEMACSAVGSANPPRGGLVIWLLVVGMAFADPGLMDRMATLDAGLEAAPCDAELRARRARLLLRSGWVTAAEQDVREAQACGPDERVDLVAAEIALHLRDAEMALRILEGRDDAAAWRLRAQAHDALSRPGEALSAREKAVERDPGATPQDLLELGDAWMRTGQHDRVVDLFLARSKRLHGVKAACRTMVDAAIAAGRAEQALPWTDGEDAELLYLRARIHKALGRSTWRGLLRRARQQLQTWRPGPGRDALATKMDEVG